MGNRKAKRQEKIRAAIGVTTDEPGFTDRESLTDAYERSTPAEFASPDASYIVPNVAGDEDQGIYADDAGQDDYTSLWTGKASLDAQLHHLLAEYDDKAAPHLATQKRNGGVVLSQLAQLKREYAAMAQELIDNYARTSAMERAARNEPRRVERAQDRQDAQRAIREFAQDLRHRGIGLPNVGRATGDITGLRENSNPFAQDDRSMWTSSGIARNMMSSGFGSFPGEMRSWR